MQEIEINAYDISSYVLIGQCPNHNNHKIKTLSLIDDIILHYLTYIFPAQVFLKLIGIYQ